MSGGRRRTECASLYLLIIEDDEEIEPANIHDMDVQSLYLTELGLNTSSETTTYLSSS